MSIVPFTYGYDAMYGGCGTYAPLSYGGAYPAYGYGYGGYPATYGYGYGSYGGYGAYPYSRRQARHLRKAGVYPYAW
jgi:hypothetical protein